MHPGGAFTADILVPRLVPLLQYANGFAEATAAGRQIYCDMDSMGGVPQWKWRLPLCWPAPCVMKVRACGRCDIVTTCSHDNDWLDSRWRSALRQTWRCQRDCMREGRAALVKPSCCSSLARSSSLASSISRGVRRTQGDKGSSSCSTTDCGPSRPWHAIAEGEIRRC